MDDKSAEETRVFEAETDEYRTPVHDWELNPLGVTLFPAHPNARFASVAGFNFETQPTSLTVHAYASSVLWGGVASTRFRLGWGS
jgi:hypothetical protein